MQQLEMEKRFQEQNQIIEQLRRENKELEKGYHEKNIEAMDLKEQLEDVKSPENRQKRDLSIKEKKKHAKALKSKNREISKLKSDLIVLNKNLTSIKANSSTLQNFKSEKEKDRLKISDLLRQRTALESDLNKHKTDMFSKNKELLNQRKEIESLKEQLVIQKAQTETHKSNADRGNQITEATLRMKKTPTDLGENVINQQKRTNSDLIKDEVKVVKEEEKRVKINKEVTSVIDEEKEETDVRRSKQTSPKVNASQGAIPDVQSFKANSNKHANEGLINNHDDEIIIKKQDEEIVIEKQGDLATPKNQADEKQNISEGSDFPKQSSKIENTPPTLKKQTKEAKKNVENMYKEKDEEIELEEVPQGTEEDYELDIKIDAPEDKEEFGDIEVVISEPTLEDMKKVVKEEKKSDNITEESKSEVVIQELKSEESTSEAQKEKIKNESKLVKISEDNEKKFETPKTNKMEVPKGSAQAKNSFCPDSAMPEPTENPDESSDAIEDEEIAKSTNSQFRNRVSIVDIPRIVKAEFRLILQNQKIPFEQMRKVFPKTKRIALDQLIDHFRKLNRFESEVILEQVCRYLVEDDARGDVIQFDKMADIDKIAI